MLNLAEKGNNQQIIRLNTADNVAIAKIDIDVGTELPEVGIVTWDHLPAGYKVARRNIERNGQEIFRCFLRIALGKETKTKVLGLGRHEISHWHIGIVGWSPVHWRQG